MPEPGRRYTLAEKLVLEREGWEFSSQTELGSLEAFYVVSGYRTARPEPPTYGDQYGTERWTHSHERVR
jgi:hypothetical protein